MDFSFEGLVMGSHSVHLWGESGLARDQRLVTIDMLPDDVLEEIFFYVNIRDREILNRWHTVVHVCRRWRYLVFASPHHLDIQLEYGGHRPMSEVLDAWPVLPVSLISLIGESDQQWNNMAAGLESEHSNRISEIYILNMNDSHWERFAAAMQKPFPELTLLQVWALDVVPVLPDSFLGGTAPRLRTLWLGRIPFPSLPELLLSANGLVKLALWHIPDSGYFSPDAIATALTVMTRLESLDITFISPRSRPNPKSRPLLPHTRVVLPALTNLRFNGAYKYLEDILARIDAPALYDLDITFFMDLDLDVPQLHRLIRHAEEFKAFNHAEVLIFSHLFKLSLYPKVRAVDRHRLLVLEINCREFDGQLSSLAQVCRSFPLISSLEDLQIREDMCLSASHWNDKMETAQWVETLDLFTALKNLYLTDGIAQRFCGALQRVSRESATEVLPALCNLFVQRSSLELVQEAMKSFVTARQLSGHSVVIEYWKD